MFAPRSQSMPVSCSDNFSPFSGERICAAMPGAILPTEPGRFEGWTGSPARGRFRVGQVRAHDRRGLGQAVAFVDGLAEALLERLRQAARQFLRARDREADAFQLRPLRFAQVAAQKSWRREHDGDALALDEFGALRGFERVRVGGDPAPRR